MVTHNAIKTARSCIDTGKITVSESARSSILSISDSYYLGARLHNLPKTHHGQMLRACIETNSVYKGVQG